MSKKGNPELAQDSYQELSNEIVKYNWLSHLAALVKEDSWARNSLHQWSWLVF